MTAPIPDHAALPVSQLRALLAIPPKWPEHLECGHCGDVAIYADAKELYWDDGRWLRCLSCGFPGQVSVDDSLDEDCSASWRLGDEPEDRCNGPCDECGVAS